MEVLAISKWAMVHLTVPLGLIGTVPTLLLLSQSVGFNAILGLIGPAAILTRNTLTLIGGASCRMVASRF